MIVLRGADPLYTAATCHASRTWFSELSVCGPEPVSRPIDAPVATAIQRVYDPQAMRESMFVPTVATPAETPVAATEPAAPASVAQDNALLFAGLGVAALLGILLLTR